MQRFECFADGASKFWEIAVEGDSFTVRYGKIGSNGQVQSKRFTSPDEAQRAAAALIREKERKGYASNAAPAEPINPQSTPIEAQPKAKAKSRLPANDFCPTLLAPPEPCTRGPQAPLEVQVIPLGRIFFWVYPGSISLYSARSREPLATRQTDRPLDLLYSEIAQRVQAGASLQSSHAFTVFDSPALMVAICALLGEPLGHALGFALYDGVTHTACGLLDRIIATEGFDAVADDMAGWRMDEKTCKAFLERGTPRFTLDQVKACARGGRLSYLEAARATGFDFQQLDDQGRSLIDNGPSETAVPFLLQMGVPFDASTVLKQFRTDDNAAATTKRAVELLRLAGAVTPIEAEPDEPQEPCAIANPVRNASGFLQETLALLVAGRRTDELDQTPSQALAFYDRVSALCDDPRFVVVPATDLSSIEASQANEPMLIRWTIGLEVSRADADLHGPGRAFSTLEVQQALADAERLVPWSAIAEAEPDASAAIVCATGPLALARLGFGVVVSADDAKLKGQDSNQEPHDEGIAGIRVDTNGDHWDSCAVDFAASAHEKRAKRYPDGAYHLVATYD